MPISIFFYMLIQASAKRTLLVGDIQLVASQLNSPYISYLSSYSLNIDLSLFPLHSQPHRHRIKQFASLLAFFPFLFASSRQLTSMFLLCKISTNFIISLVKIDKFQGSQPNASQLCMDKLIYSRLFTGVRTFVHLSLQTGTVTIRIFGLNKP